ncbi:MAG: ABC transporter permease subunit [Peptococcus niger]
MRIADIFMSFPAMILVLVLVAVVGPSVWSVTLVIGVMGWPQFARLIYGNVLSVREKEYVESARAIGTKNLTLLSNTFCHHLSSSYCHDLPHCTGYHYGILPQFSGHGVQRHRRLGAI